MPVVALSLALFLQGLMGTAAIAAVFTPALSAPDGTVLTFADICNTSDTAVDEHCHACTHPHPVDVPTVLPVATSSTAVPSGPFAAPGRPLLSRPEATHCPATGPPFI